MRLIITFDHDFQFKETDIVIAKDKPTAVVEAQFIKVDAFGDIDYVDDLEKLKNDLVNSYESKVIKGAIFSSINNFNRNWILPLFKWIDTIEYALLQNDFKEIIIVGFTKNINYLPYYEAEGEIGSQLLYKDYDVIPGLVESYLKKKGALNLKTENTKSAFKLRLRIFIRRYILLAYKVFAFLLKKFKTRNLKTPIIDFGKIKFLFSTRSIAHSEYMFNFFKTFNSETVIHVNDGLNSGNKNLDFTQKQSFSNVVTLYKTVSIIKVFTVFFTISKSLFSIKKKYYFELRGLKMNMTSAIREMLISYFDALIYKESILKTIKDNKLVLVTGEMYTPYAYTVSQIGKEKQNVTVQLQTTSMMVRNEPNFVYCDTFLMNSKANADAFKALYPEKAMHINYYGSLLYNEENVKQKEVNKTLKKVIYFTQPQIEEDIEFKIIDELIRLESKFHFKIYVKLHPRERANKLERYNEALNIIDNKLIFKEYISDFDLAVIRNTSLGSSIILEGIPIITCLLSETARKSKLDYINHKYYGTLFTLDELEPKINDFSILTNEFTAYRERFIELNELTKGVHYFHKSFEE